MAYSGKVAVITGGGSGMGQLAARRFADTGAQVAILDVNEEGMAKTAEGLSNVHAHRCDITDADGVKEVIGNIESSIGPIDRLFNCAAIMPFGKLIEQDVKVQQRVMTINVTGLMNVTSAALPAMVARGRGDYVSFASMAGLIPGMLMGAYGASKAAVAFYNEILYHENRDSGLRFVSVCPAVVGTPLLKQAHDTVWPKIMDTAPPLDPKQVIDEVEDCLERGKFLCTPGKGAGFGYLMRRLMPGSIWKHNHKVEGF